MSPPEETQATAPPPSQMPAFFENEEPSLELAMDLEVWLESRRETENLRVASRVRGWVDDRAIFVDVPSSSGGPLTSRKNERFTVRFVLDGVVYTFETEFARKIAEPCELWCLKYPDVVQCRTLRREVRVNTVFPVTIDGVDAPALVIDISEGGALIDAPPSLKAGEGTPLKLSFGLPTGEQVSDLEAEVRHVDSKGHLGVSFATEESAAEKIRGYLVAARSAAAEASPAGAQQADKPK